MARYIDAEIALKTIDSYAKTVTADGKVVVDAIRDIVSVITPTADVAPKSEVAREIFEEIDQLFDLVCHMIGVEIISFPQYAELKKKYTEEKE